MRGYFSLVNRTSKQEGVEGRGGGRRKRKKTKREEGENREKGKGGGDNSDVRKREGRGEGRKERKTEREENMPPVLPPSTRLSSSALGRFLGGRVSHLPCACRRREIPDHPCPELYNEA